MAEIAKTAGTENQVVGKVFILYGTVKAIAQDGTERILAPNSPVYADERIITGSDGSVSIQFDGPPVTQLDLGRMTEIVIDQDVYAGVTPEVVSEAAAEAEQVQQSLLEGDQPIELEATAAGGATGAGGGHPVVNFALDGGAVTPGSGADTTGITTTGVDTLGGVFAAAPAAPAAIDDVPTGGEASYELLEGATDSYTVPAGTGLDIPVTAVVGEYTGSLGTLVTVDADGNFSYTAPVLDQSDETADNETFTFNLVDSDGSPTTSTVTFAIGDTGATGSEASYELLEGATASYTVPGGTSLDIPVTAVVGEYTGSLGTVVTVDGDGNFSYTAPVLDQSDETADNETFTFNLVDSDGSTTTSTVTFEIGNDMPMATNDGQLASVDDNVTGVTIGTAAGLLSNDHFGADGQGTPAITGISAGSLGGAVMIDGSGNLLYTSATNITNPYAAVTETFIYTIKDADGDTTTATFTVRLTDTGATIGTPVNSSVDEEGLAGGNAGDSYASGDLAGQAISVTGKALNINWGVDDGAGRTVTFDALQPGLAGLASDGAAVSFTILGNGTLVGYTGATVPTDVTSGDVAFYAALNSAGTGSYDFTLVKPLDHPTVGIEDDKDLPFAFTAKDAEGEGSSKTFSVTVDDDAPISSDSHGIIHNAVGEVLPGVLSYDMGADGLGNVSLTVPTVTSNDVAITLKSHGDTVAWDVQDGNSDGVDELYGYVEKGTNDPGYDQGTDHLVMTVAPTSPDPDANDGVYAVTLNDVIDDQPSETDSFSVKGVYTHSPIGQQVLTDIDSSSPFVMLATPIGGIENQGVLLVNSYDGEFGINNTTMNYSSDSADNEVIKLEFGTSTTFVNGVRQVTGPVVLNDVSLNAFNVGGNETDSFHWYAFNNGTQVADGVGSYTNPPSGGGGYSFAPIHTDSGFDTLKIEMAGGDFKIAGFSYTTQGEAQDVTLHFGYSGADADGDTFAGAFDVTISSDDDVLTQLLGDNHTT